MSNMVIDKLNNMFLQQKLGFYRKDSEEGIILKIPYEIVNKKTKLEIDILSLNNEDTYIIGFTQSIIKEDSDDVNRELLDMNASLLRGRLSVKKSTQEVNYSMTVSVSENEELDYKEYRQNLHYCFYVYFQLCDYGIIEKKRSVEHVEV